MRTQASRHSPRRHHLLLPRLPIAASLFTQSTAPTFASKAATFASAAGAAAAKLTMPQGLLFWIGVDVAIQWAGWAVSTLLKVKR